MTRTPSAPTMRPPQVRQDIRVGITFTPADSIGATVVDLDGPEVGLWLYYQLVAAAAQRLAAYAEDYRRAAEEDREVGR